MQTVSLFSLVERILGFWFLRKSRFNVFAKDLKFNGWFLIRRKCEYSSASLCTASFSSDFADTRFLISSKKFRCTLILKYKVYVETHRYMVFDVLM